MFGWFFFRHSIHFQSAINFLLEKCSNRKFFIVHCQLTYSLIFLPIYLLSFPFVPLICANTYKHQKGLPYMLERAGLDVQQGQISLSWKKTARILIISLFFFSVVIQWIWTLVLAREKKKRIVICEIRSIFTSIHIAYKMHAAVLSAQLQRDSTVTPRKQYIGIDHSPTGKVNEVATCMLANIIR